MASKGSDMTKQRTLRERERNRNRSKRILMKMMFMNCGPFIDDYLGFNVARRSKRK